MTDEKLRAVVNSVQSAAESDRALFNERERLAIELADAMVAAPANVSDDLYARLRGLFSEEQLLELGAHIAFENYRARFNRLFDVESDELYAAEAGA